MKGARLLALFIVLVRAAPRPHAAAAEVQAAPNQTPWRSCAGQEAAFAISSVEVEPGVVPRGGRMVLTISGLAKQAVTAGQATLRVFYWGVPVLTASDTLCTAPQPRGSSGRAVWAQRRSLAAPAGAEAGTGAAGRRARRPAGVLRLWWRAAAGDDPAGGTCAMPAGPVTLTHDAVLPQVAPPGHYSMRVSAADAVSGQELLCVDTWFRVS